MALLYLLYFGVIFPNHAHIPNLGVVFDKAGGVLNSPMWSMKIIPMDNNDAWLSDDSKSSKDFYEGILNFTYGNKAELRRWQVRPGLATTLTDLTTFHFYPCSNYRYFKGQKHEILAKRIQNEDLKVLRLQRHKRSNVSCLQIWSKNDH